MAFSLNAFFKVFHQQLKAWLSSRHNVKPQPQLAFSLPVPSTSIWTHHTCRLYSLRHTAGIWIAPEHMALEMLVPSVHNKGECVRVPSHTHEGQETDTTLYDHLLLFFLLRQPGGSDCCIWFSSLIDEHCLFVCKNIPLPFLWWRPEWYPRCLEWQASSPPFQWRIGDFLLLHWWCPYLRTHKKMEQWEEDVSQDAQMGFSVRRRTDGPRDGRHTQIQHMKLLHQLSLWHGKLCRQNRRLSSPHIPCRTFIRVSKTKTFP